MTVILSTDTTQPDSPILASLGLGYHGIESTLSTENSQYDSPLTQILGWGYRIVPSIREYLLSPDISRYDSPLLQILGWGYSARQIQPITPTKESIPTWMSPDYPFVEPSEDIQGLVVDTLLSFDDPLNQFTAPIKLSRFTKHSEGVYSVRFTDSSNHAVFDSSIYEYTTEDITITEDKYTDKASSTDGKCVFKSTTWGDYYELLYWETELVTLKMIIRKTTEPMFAIYPDNGEMDARSLYQYPKRIRSIQVINKDKESHYVTVQPNIVFKSGYNMDIEVTDDSSTIRNSSILEFSAVSGSGQGKVPSTCGESVNNIVSINTITPTDDGAFFITTDPCHTVRGTSSVSLGNDCTPCCTCEDMSDTGRFLNEVEDEYYKMGGQTKILLDRLKEQIENLTELLENQEESSNVEYSINPNCPFATFRFVFRNAFSFCLPNLTVVINFGSSARIVKGSSRKAVPCIKETSDCYVIDEVPTEFELTNGTLTITWDKPIASGQQVYAIGVVRYSTKSISSTVTSVSYIPSDSTKSIKISIDGENGGTYTCEDSQFEDYTEDLTDDEIQDLEDEIRQICTDNSYDEDYRRNTNATSL